MASLGHNELNVLFHSGQTSLCWQGQHASILRHVLVWLFLPIISSEQWPLKTHDWPKKDSPWYSGNENILCDFFMLICDMPVMKIFEISSNMIWQSSHRVLSAILNKVVCTTKMNSFWFPTKFCSVLHILMLWYQEILRHLCYMHSVAVYGWMNHLKSQICMRNSTK